MNIEKYTNEYGKECWRGVECNSAFAPELFHKPDYQPEGDESFAFHTNLGSLTVLDRMTGFGWRDVETGYRDMDGNFWLASGNFDIRYYGCKTVGEAIELIKSNANTCVGNNRTTK